MVQGVQVVDLTLVTLSCHFTSLRYFNNLVSQLSCLLSALVSGSGEASGEQEVWLRDSVVLVWTWKM